MIFRFASKSTANEKKKNMRTIHCCCIHISSFFGGCAICIAMQMRQLLSFYHFSRSHIHRPTDVLFFSFRFVKCQQFALMASITDTLLWRNGTAVDTYRPWHLVGRRYSCDTLHAPQRWHRRRRRRADDVLCDTNIKSMFGAVQWKNLLLSQKAKLCNATWLKERTSLVKRALSSTIRTTMTRLHYGECVRMLSAFEYRPVGSDKCIPTHPHLKCEYRKMATSAC